MIDADATECQPLLIASIRDNAVMMKKYEKDGFDSLAVKLAFEVYLEKLLLPPGERDFERFKEQVEGRKAEG